MTPTTPSPARTDHDPDAPGGPAAGTAAAMPGPRPTQATARAGTAAAMPGPRPTQATARVIPAADPPQPPTAAAPPVVTAALAPPAGWAAEAVAAVRRDPSTLATHLAWAARRTSREALRPATDPGGTVHGTVADAARAALVVAAFDSGLDPAALAGELRDRYREGDSGERRGVLRGLDALTVRGPLPPELVAAGRELAADALRTNDPSLVAAATGPFAAAHLDQHTWRHAVVKLVFQQVSLDAVAGLTERADAELARMAGDLAAERRAAGRTVPDDLARIAGPRNQES
ncbi:EboA domain-containing protein [Cellulomonas denverensis]|uniref:Sugar phosphate isomerase n=2 Tax=Cellulomonas denverensis TaxID=264297 RepID=A0A7X6KXX7_9CELL|nr:EboA domain-containing protein [Cellulomonas denverensis]NKY24020.1 hypothetical protein [Cellulomonas denverensis]